MRITGSRWTVAAALTLLTAVPLTAHAGDAARAKRDLMFARDNAQSERWDDLDTNMKKAATDMAGLSDAEKAPLLAEIAAIKAVVTKSVEDDVTKRLDRVAKAEPGGGKLDAQRAQMRLASDEAKAYADPAVLEKLSARLASLTGGGAPTTPTTDTPPTPKTATPKGPMSDELQTATSNARTAHIMLEQGDPNIAMGLVRRAFKALENVPEADRAPLTAELTKLTADIDAAELKAQRAEETRRVTEQVGRYVRTAETSIQDGVVCDSEWIDKSDALLATFDVKTFMDGAEIKKYQARLDDTRAKLKAHNKATAISRSADVLKEYEEKADADPFKGAGDIEANKVFTSLKYLGDRVRGEFARVPKDDPEIKAVLARVDAADAKVEAGAGKWALEQMQEQFAARWAFTLKGFEGWEAEKPAADALAKAQFDGLSNTTRAVAGTLYWMNDPETKKVVDKYKDNPVVAATVTAARKTLDDASAKLNEAFSAALAAVEARPVPEREADRMLPVFLGHDAADWFRGTKYQEANVARAAAIDAKWKAEAARVAAERAATLKQMTAEASAAWPKIDASIQADAFNPGDADRLKGKTVKIKGYYNRTGWDFDAQYDYAVGIKGVPVAGTYAPHVRDAFVDVQRRSHWGIDDHTGWDVIAVVDGPGTIRRRVTTEWKDASTRQVIMKTESYVAEPCVLITVIGLHTGPLAVGPK